MQANFDPNNAWEQELDDLVGDYELTDPLLPMEGEDEIITELRELLETPLDEPVFQSLDVYEDQLAALDQRMAEKEIRRGFAEDDLYQEQIKGRLPTSETLRPGREWQPMDFETNDQFLTTDGIFGIDDDDRMLSDLTDMELDQLEEKVAEAENSILTDSFDYEAWADQEFGIISHRTRIYPPVL